MNALTQELVELLSLEKLEENIFRESAGIWWASVCSVDRF